jgi:hypothetical protein
MEVFAPARLLADSFTYSWLHIGRETYLGKTVDFFVYDTIKIGILLLVINYLMAVIRHYLPVEKIRDFLTAREWFGLDYLLASGFGVITPFCSCSSIPLFIGFLSAAIPLGVTLSFLITSPLVNEASIAVFIGLFGWRITLEYILTGVVIGVAGGLILGRMKLEGDIEETIRKIIQDGGSHRFRQTSRPLKELVGQFWHEGWDLTKSIFPYVVAGVGLGAVIHGYVPMNFFRRYLEGGSWWSVPAAALLAIPLYSNAVAVIPVMEALVAKGVPFGTALAFMMATVGLSFPEALILKKALKTRALLAFFGTVAIGIVLTGYLFNFVFLGS